MNTRVSKQKIFKPVYFIASLSLSSTAFMPLVAESE